MDDGIQAEIADELAGLSEALYVADGRGDAGGGRVADAANGHQQLSLGR
jgi:hypothetical protein